MAYIISYESQGVEFPRYIRTKTGLDVQGVVVIKGGAGVIDKKTLETPKGVKTEVSEEELAFLKTQSLFNDKVKTGFYEIEESEKKATTKAKKGNGKKDKGAQLTADDFIEAGQTPPKVGASEKADDGSVLKQKQAEAEL